MTGTAQRPARCRRRWPWVLAAVGVLALLPVVGMLIYDWHWQHKVDALIASYRAKGEPVTWEELMVARDKLPADQNSALIFQDALAKVPGGDDPAWNAIRSLMYTGDPGSRPAPESVELLRAYLKAQAPALAIIHKGAALPTGVYPPGPATAPADLDTPYLGPMWQAIRLCGLKAELRALDGDAAGAVESLVAARRLCASVGECWTVGEEMARTARDGDMVGAIEQCLALCQFPTQGLAQLRQELAREESELSMGRALLSERAVGYCVFNQAPTQDLQMVAHSYGPASRLRVWAYGPLPGIRNHDALAYYAYVDSYIALAELPVEELVAKIGGPLRRAHEDAFWIDAPPFWWPPAFEDIYDGYLKRLVTAVAELRVADTALAVEQWRMKYGRWPEALDDLVPEFLKAVPRDPYGKGAISYAPTERGVIIYSVGPDGVDDGGTPLDVWYKRTPTGSPELGDMPFLLLNPELRGAAQMTFSEAVRKSGIEPKGLESLGFAPAQVKALGVEPKGD